MQRPAPCSFPYFSLADASEKSVTSAGVECANSTLKLVKSVTRSARHQDRLNALVLLKVRKVLHVRKVLYYSTSIIDKIDNY